METNPVDPVDPVDTDTNDSSINESNGASDGVEESKASSKSESKNESDERKWNYFEDVIREKYYSKFTDNENEFIEKYEFTFYIYDAFLTIKKAIKKKNRLNFGFLYNNNHEYPKEFSYEKKIKDWNQKINQIAIPFRASEDPVKTSEFSDFMLATVYTVISHLSTKKTIIRSLDLQYMIDKLQDIEKKKPFEFILDPSKNVKLKLLQKFNKTDDNLTDDEKITMQKYIL